MSRKERRARMTALRAILAEIPAQSDICHPEAQEWLSSGLRGLADTIDPSLARITWESHPGLPSSRTIVHFIYADQLRWTDRWPRLDRLRSAPKPVAKDDIRFQPLTGRSLATAK